jgi:hypothetical protein
MFHQNAADWFGTNVNPSNAVQIDSTNYRGNCEFEVCIVIL